MKKFLIFSCLVVFSLSFAQQTSGLSEVDFLITKEQYLKMSETDLYKSERAAALTMIVSLKSADKVDFTKDDESFFNWIKENLAITKFGSVEEAVELMEKCEELHKKLRTEYSYIYDCIQKATVKQAAEILAPDRLTRSEARLFLD